jgi:hypothetical protein
MNDEQMRPLLEVWLRDRQIPPPRAQAGVAKVMANVPRTRQQGRRWPFPVFYRKPQSPTATDTVENQPRPIPATDGHTPTVIGRTQPMFSPSKALIAGALVFGIGGALLIAQPFEQRSTAPGAESEAVAPAWVTGQIGWASGCTGPDTEVDGAVTHEWNYDCSPQTWTASDPRLSGEVAARWNNDVYQIGGRRIEVNSSLDVLTNDVGRWVCTSTGLLEGPGASVTWLGGGLTTTCVGQDGFEGLSAAFFRSESTGGGSEEFAGLIFSGDFPPVPEPPATE